MEPVDEIYQNIPNPVPDPKRLSNAYMAYHEACLRVTDLKNRIGRLDVKNRNLEAWAQYWEQQAGLHNPGAEKDFLLWRINNNRQQLAANATTRLSLTNELSDAEIRRRRRGKDCEPSLLTVMEALFTQSDRVGIADFLGSNDRDWNIRNPWSPLPKVKTN